MHCNAYFRVDYKSILYMLYTSNETTLYKLKNLLLDDSQRCMYLPIK
jgi:hypothetical protein